MLVSNKPFLNGRYFNFAILNMEIITFNSGPTTTAEQQTTTHEITTDDSTTDETTTMETNDGSTDNLITIIIGTLLGGCVLIGIIIIIIIVLVKKRCHKRDYVKTTKQENSNETRERTANKTDTLDHMAMQHGKPRNHAVSKPGNPGLVYAQNDHHVGYDDGNPDYDRRNYYGNLNMNLSQKNRLLIMIERMIMVVICNEAHR